MFAKFLKLQSWNVKLSEEMCAKIIDVAFIDKKQFENAKKNQSRNPKQTP